jgi:hypothetical protein
MDCSIAGALGLPDKLSHRAEKFLEIMLRDGEVWVPPLWWYEMSNLLVVAMRRKRLTQAAMNRLAELYSSLPVLWTHRLRRLFPEPSKGSQSNTDFPPMTLPTWSWRIDWERAWRRLIETWSGLPSQAACPCSRWTEGCLHAQIYSDMRQDRFSFYHACKNR